MESVVHHFPVPRTHALFRGYIYCQKTSGRNSIRLYATQLSEAEYVQCCQILQVRAGSDQETVRQAFLQLVKRFHPDSDSHEADAYKFQEIERAYRTLQQKFHSERWSKEDCAGEYGLYYKEKKGEDIAVVQLDIKHTAPQHRQYLTYDGFGAGTPSQRHKQYQKLRASNAVENVYNHRISKLQEAESLNIHEALVAKDRDRAKNIKTRYGMDRLVEDLIQESMARGEFDNLTGKGKPLSRKHDHHNPYVDLVTHKLNQVMIDNGFTPEWIMLQKEIREDAQGVREALRRLRDSMPPLLSADDERWRSAVKSLSDNVKALNNKIGKYNLVVPLLPNQMLLFDLEKESCKVLAETPKTRNTVARKNVPAKSESSDSFLEIIMSVFNR